MLRWVGLFVIDWVFFYWVNIEVESVYNFFVFSYVGVIGFG